MADIQKLSVQPRALLGKKVGRLRREGKLPAVLAGHHDPSLAIETETHAFELGYRRWGGTTLLSLEGLPGGEVPALIQGVSRNPRTGKLIHIDFQRVSLTEKTHAEVPLHFVGESPAVKTLGALLFHALEHVTVEAFPQDMPRRIDIDLTPLAELDDAIHVRDLVVDTTKLRILADGDELVVKTIQPRVEEVAAPVAATAGAAPAADADAGKAEPAAAAKPEAKKG